jgi:beta-catenin-like protein 1
VRQYSSELLAIFFQESRPNRLKLIEYNGVETILQILSVYRKKDPEDADEIEMMENLFDCVCSCLHEPEIKHAFLISEGLELMLVMIREKKMSRIRAFKVIDHALTGNESQELAHRFIEILGLKTLFAAFMKKGIKAFKKQYSAFSETAEEGKI